MRVRVALGLGSNSGPRKEHLDGAVQALRTELEDVRASTYRETEPVGGPPQPPYLNAALVGWTSLSPRELLELGLRLEREAGRRPGPRWGPRPLDVDLLLYGDRVLEEPDLRVPHPRLVERLFVLDPLAELEPAWRVPGTGRSVAALRRALLEAVG